jgi:hypothetical protein
MHNLSCTCNGKTAYTFGTKTTKEDKDTRLMQANAENHQIKLQPYVFVYHFCYNL